MYNDWEFVYIFIYLHTRLSLRLATAIADRMVGEGENTTLNESLTWMGYPPSLPTQGTRRAVEIVCLTALSSLLCLFGIPTNILNCLVFWRQGLNDRMNLCLFSLALVDFCYLLITFVVYCVSSFIKLFDWLVGEEYYVKSIVTSVGVVNGLRSSSEFICTVIAVERWTCVMCPLRAHTLIRTRTMGGLILLSIFLFQAVYLSTPFAIRASVLNVDRYVQWIIAPTQFQQDYAFLVKVLGVTVLEVIFPIASFVIVSITTVITIIKLKAASAWREEASMNTGKKYNQQMALTKMLVIVSCVYILTMVPLVARGLSLLTDEARFVTGTYNDISMIVSAVVNMCPRINSSIHFIVYCFQSTRFRNELACMFSSSFSKAGHLPSKSF